MANAGNLEASRIAYQAARTQWKGADAGLPAMQQAKLKLAGLKVACHCPERWWENESLWRRERDSNPQWQSTILKFVAEGEGFEPP